MYSPAETFGRRNSSTRGNNSPLSAIWNSDSPILPPQTPFSVFYPALPLQSPTPPLPFSTNYLHDNHEATLSNFSSLNLLDRDSSMLNDNYSPHFYPSPSFSATQTRLTVTEFLTPLSVLDTYPVVPKQVPNSHTHPTATPSSLFQSSTVTNLRSHPGTPTQSSPTGPSPQISDHGNLFMPSIWSSTPETSPMLFSGFMTPRTYGLTTRELTDSECMLPSSMFADMKDDMLPIVREITASNLRVDGKKLTQCYFEGISNQVSYIVGMVILERDVKVKRREIGKTIDGLAKMLWPKCRTDDLEGLCDVSIVGSDLELCIWIPETSDNAVQCVEKLGHLLKQVGMKDTKMLTRCRIPIVKTSDITTNLYINIEFKPNCCLSPTHLISLYLQIDERFRKLIIIILFWAKRRNLNNPHLGTLSTYCYILMILHLLQIRDVMPALHNLGTSDCYFDDLGNLDWVWKKSNTESIGELVLAEFPIIHGVASIRYGKILSKEDKGWTKDRHVVTDKVKGGKDRFWLCVEDPLDLNENVARTIDKETLFKLRGELIRASKLFCAGDSGLNEFIVVSVCEKVER
ncbi:hypothetical protein HK096_000139 [Nowakowskiella sp. JEL0078]|nr:hypothetical protein HK096_000139 [Nowakowskiella sp. JEL0078]